MLQVKSFKSLEEKLEKDVREVLNSMQAMEKQMKLTLGKLYHLNEEINEIKASILSEMSTITMVIWDLQDFQESHKTSSKSS